MFGLSQGQVPGICPLFPKERSGKRVDDRKVLRSIIHGIRRCGGIDATDLKAYPTASSLDKGRTEPRLMGRQGGMTSKLHGVCHHKGGPLRFHLGEGQCSDFTGADGGLKDLLPAAAVMGNQGYGRGKIPKMLAQQGTTPYIPSRPVAVAAASSRSMTTRGWITGVTQSRRSVPDGRTGSPLQPATTVAPLSSALPSSWPPLASSADES